MTRKRGGKKKQSGGGGFMSGMRRGVQTAAGAHPNQPSKRAKLFWNLVTIALAVVAGYFLLRRFGVL